jgi:uncharacterized membrane protein
MNRLTALLAKVMLTGTLVSAAIIAAGLAWYLSAHLGTPPGDHIFRGEPKYFESPVAMVRHSLALDQVGHRRSLVMIGIFLLLLNPLIRVALASAGYLLEGDRLYAAISALVFAVLLVSFFW